MLAAAKEFKAAADLLVPARASVEDSIKIADLYAGARQWELAEQELNKIREDATATPEMKLKATRELAKVLAWGGKHTERLALLGEIVVKREPLKTTLEMRILQADVNVWAKNLDQAAGSVSAADQGEAGQPGMLQESVSANAAAKSTAPINDEALAQLLRLQRTSRRAMKPRMPSSCAPRGRGVCHARTQRYGSGQATRPESGPARPAGPDRPPRGGVRSRARKLVSTRKRMSSSPAWSWSATSVSNTCSSPRRRRTTTPPADRPGFTWPSNCLARSRSAKPRRLLADVLTWKGDYEEALALYERLAAETPKDRDLKIEIAQVYRYWQDYPMALTKFAELVGEDRESKALAIRPDHDAASECAASRGFSRRSRCCWRSMTKYAPTFDDARAMSRFWRGSCTSSTSRPAAHPLLTRAVAANPQQPDVRKELAGALAALERRPEAIQLLTVPDVLAGLDITELLNLADLLTAENQLDRAEQELAKVVTDKSDRRSLDA